LKKKVYKSAVPNQRASGQKQVIVVLKEDFLDKIDRNLPSMGFGDRAQFIRQAVKEKLQANGVSVSAFEVTPPSRAGKGGRPKRQASEAVVLMNEDTTPAPMPTQKAVTYQGKKKSKK